MNLYLWKYLFQKLQGVKIREMKNLVILLLVSLLSTTMFMACEEDDFDDVTTEPLSVNTGLLAGTWTLNTVVQVDQDAVDNGFPEAVQKQDITDLYAWSETTITFNLDAEGNPETFSVNEGSAPNYLVTSGEWSVDHPVFTSEIELTGETEDDKSILVIEDIQETRLTARIERTSTDDIVFVRYDVVFVK